MSRLGGGEGLGGRKAGEGGGVQPCPPPSRASGPCRGPGRAESGSSITGRGLNHKPQAYRAPPVEQTPCLV